MSREFYQGQMAQAGNAIAAVAAAQNIAATLSMLGNNPIDTYLHQTPIWVVVLCVAIAAGIYTVLIWKASCIELRLLADDPDNTGDKLRGTVRFLGVGRAMVVIITAAPLAYVGACFAAKAMPSAGASTLTISITRPAHR